MADWSRAKDITKPQPGLWRGWISIGRKPNGRKLYAPVAVMIEEWGPPRDPEDPTRFLDRSYRHACWVNENTADVNEWWPNVDETPISVDEYEEILAQRNWGRMDYD